MTGSLRPEITRRPADQTDVAFLVQLRHLTMDVHLAASGTGMSEDAHLERVLARFDCAEIVMVRGKPAGLLKVAREGETWTLIQIQIVPELQGSGLGAQLIEEVIAQARSAGAAVELDVLKANPARRLYERLGFVVVGENAYTFDMRLAANRGGIA